MSLATPIPLQLLCHMAVVSRAGFYRWRRASPDPEGTPDRDMDVHDEIQRIALEWPC